MHYLFLWTTTTTTNVWMYLSHLKFIFFPNQCWLLAKVNSIHRRLEWTCYGFLKKKNSNLKKDEFENIDFKRSRNLTFIQYWFWTRKFEKLNKFCVVINLTVYTNLQPFQIGRWLSRNLSAKMMLAAGRFVQRKI